MPFLCILRQHLVHLYHAFSPQSPIILPLHWTVVDSCLAHVCSCTWCEEYYTPIYHHHSILSLRSFLGHSDFSPFFCLLVFPPQDYQRFDTEALGEEIDGWSGANAYCLGKGLVLLSESQLCPNGPNNFPIGGVAVNSNPGDVIISAVSGNNNYVILTGTHHQNLDICEGNVPLNNFIVADGKHSGFGDFYENKFIYCTAVSQIILVDTVLFTCLDSPFLGSRLAETNKHVCYSHSFSSQLRLCLVTRMSSHLRT